VGVRILDVVFFREKNFKRETKVVNMLNFIKGNLWKVCRHPGESVPLITIWKHTFPHV
jgi:hypothetical protein